MAPGVGRTDTGSLVSTEGEKGGKYVQRGKKGERTEGEREEAGRQAGLAHHCRTGENIYTLYI